MGQCLSLDYIWSVPFPDFFGRLLLRRPTHLLYCKFFPTRSTPQPLRIQLHNGLSTPTSINMSTSPPSFSIRLARAARAQTSPSMIPLRSRLEFLMTGIAPVTTIRDTECTICTEPLIDDVVEFTKCGHVFHCVCILGWLQGPGTANRKCPVCRNVLFEVEPSSHPHSAALLIRPVEPEVPQTRVWIDFAHDWSTVGLQIVSREMRASPNHSSNNRLSGTQPDRPANLQSGAVTSLLLGPRASVLTLHGTHATGTLSAGVEDIQATAPSVALSSPPASQQSSTIPNDGPVTHPTPLPHEERAGINAMHARLDRANASLAGTLENMRSMREDMREMSEMILNLRSQLEP